MSESHSNESFCSSGVGLLFCSYQPTAAFSSPENIVNRLYKSLNKGKSKIFNYYVWGEFDYVGVVYTVSTNELLKLSRIAPGIGPGIKTFSINLGTVIYEDNDFKSNLNDKFRLPFKAFCSVKCNRILIRESSSTLKQHSDVWAFFDEFVSINKDIKNTLSKMDNKNELGLSVQIIAPYSWKDFIIILQSNCIESIKKYLVLLRQKSFDTPQPRRRHLFFSTDSIIGIPFSSPSKILKNLSKINKAIVDTDIEYIIRLRIRPGHSSWVTNKLTDNLTLNNSNNLNYYIGSYDISLKPNGLWSIKDFLKWYFHKFTPVIKTEGASILSIRTDFMLPFEMNDQVGSSPSSSTGYPFLETALKIKRSCNKYLPDHILSALVSVGSTFEYLINQHSTIREEYDLVSNAFAHFLKTFDKQVFPILKQIRNQSDFPLIIQHVAEVIEEFIYIFAERFRGGHPVGASHAELPTVTYSGSFQKILQGIEILVKQLLQESGEHIQKTCYGSYDQKFFVCCRIRNTESPSNLIIFHNAFIHLPLDSLLFQENWYYNVHEIGHILMTELLLVLKEKDPLKYFHFHQAAENVTEHIEELFADAFSLHLLFADDVEMYMNFLVDIYCKRLIKWEIPEKDVELRKQLLIAWSNLKRGQDYHLKNIQLDSLLRFIPVKEQNDFSNLYQLICDHINNNDIIKWLIALKDIRPNDTIVSLCELIEQSKSIYFEKNYTQEALVKLHGMRRRMIHELWFKSVVT